MRLAIPIVLALIGSGAGIGAGYVLRPAEETPREGTEQSGISEEHAAAATATGSDAVHASEPAEGEHAQAGNEFVKLNNQFIVPVLKDGRVTSMVVVSLTLETVAGRKEDVYALEPKIRDGFLQVMFDYANAGGFDGTFTSGRALGHLREALKEKGIQMMGNTVVDVLVTDIARQDS